MADTAENTVHATGGWLRIEKVFPRIVFAALGLLLVVTALLKAQGPADGALGQNTMLFSPRLQFAVVVIEAILGLWLLSGWAGRAAWFFAVAFFLVVAGFSLYLALMGQSSCGCFGRIHVSPWSDFTLDVACLAMLGLCRSSFRGEKGEITVQSQRLGEALSIVGWAVVILMICLVGVLIAGGSPPADFLARVRGDRITVEPPVADMGSDVAGQQREFTVHLYNHTDHTVRIVGGTTDCPCIVTGDLPVSIPPGGSVPVTVHARFKGTPGLFQQEFFFYTDDKELDKVVARFGGRVVSP
jgi:hypothetical protein